MIILRQSLFARADYEGLDEIAKSELKAERSQLAKELAAKRNKINQQYSKNLGDIEKAKNIYISQQAPWNDPKKIDAHKIKQFQQDIEINHGSAVRDRVDKMLGRGLDANAQSQGALRNRNMEYSNALSNTRREAGWTKDDLLKDTAKRQRKAEETKKINEMLNRPKKVPAQQTVTNTAAKSGKFLKNIGLGALGVGAAVGLAYGGKKAYDHYKNKKKEGEN